MAIQVFWNKSQICNLVNLDSKYFDSYLSDNCKKEVNYKKGHQFFKDKQVLIILKDLLPAKNINEIRALIGYREQFELFDGYK